VTDPTFLLDSNILINILLDMDCLPSRRVQSFAPGLIVSSAIVYAEVMRGIPARL